MKGQWITYSAAELAWVKANAHLLRTDLHAGFVATFNRPEISKTNLASLCKRQNWLAGRTGRFAIGNTSHNAGQKGVRYPGSEKGWFRKGERRGVATKLYKPIGTQRVSKDGYVERKINDDLPLQRRWRAVHLVEWEALHGPMPKGMALKCLDGDKANTSPSNWALVPRALLPRLNGKYGRNYDTAAPEVKPTILAIARL